MDKKITFITGNPGKAEQLSKYLGIDISNTKIDLEEIQSLDLSEIIKHKVSEAYKIVNGPVIVDDVSLSIRSLGKLPGPFIKFFIQEIGNDGITKMTSILADKSAIAEVAIGYFDGKNMEIFIGTIKGTIAEKPKGSGGFGWDAIFIPNGYTQTRAEMTENDYDETSPRKSALIKLNKYLKELN